MDIYKLNELCKQIKGVQKTRISKFKDCVFVYFKPIPVNPKSFADADFHYFQDCIHLDDWKFSLEVTRAECEMREILFKDRI